jgi:hypothetical protein
MTVDVIASFPWRGCRRTTPYPNRVPQFTMQEKDLKSFCLVQSDAVSDSRHSNGCRNFRQGRLCFFGVEFVNRQHKPFRPSTMASSTHLVMLVSGTFSISVLPSLPWQYLTEPTTPSGYRVAVFMDSTRTDLFQLKQSTWLEWMPFNQK